MAADTSTKKYDIFICHAKEDTKVASAMCAFLEEKKFSCWIASRDIPPGKDYAASIIGAIQSSKIMVVILSGNANHSNHVRIEVERAFKNDANILPFRIQDVQPEQALEYYLSAYQWLDALSAGPETYFEVLAQNCATLVGRDLSTPVQKSAEEAPLPPKPPIKEPDAPVVPEAKPKAEEAKPVVNDQPVTPPKPAAEEKTILQQQPAVQPPPVVQQNTTPPPPPSVRPVPNPPFIKPPARPAGSSAKTLLFALGGIAILVVLFFIYKITLQKHAIWFRNYTLTPVYIELDGNLTKIESGDSVEYWAKNKYHLQTKASTYVLNSKGGVLGQNLEWDVDTTVSSWHSIHYPLSVGPGYFLLQVTNSSPANISYMEINSGDVPDYSYKYDIYIPNDGKVYNMGYFRTLDNLSVYVKDASNHYIQWNNGSTIHYPNLYNQWVKVPFSY